MSSVQGRSPTARQVNLAGFVACVLMLGYALYTEKFLGLEPCPLCMFQRVGVAALGLVFLALALAAPASRAGRWVGVLLLLLAAAVPAGVAARHVYVQSLPEGSVPACGATLDYLLDVFPLFEVVRKVLTGGGECARIDWSFLGLSMPAWVLISVVVLALAGAASSLRLRSAGPGRAL